MNTLDDGFDKSEGHSVPLPRFNLATMSGVHLGSRTQQFYKIHLHEKDETADDTLRWGVLFQDDKGNEALHRFIEVDGATTIQAEPFWTSTGPRADILASGLSVRTCGTCTFWTAQRSTACSDAPERANEAALPHRVGSCRIRRAGQAIQTADIQGTQAAALIYQTSLGLDCSHWQRRTDEDINGAAEKEVPMADEEGRPKAARTWWGRLIDGVRARPGRVPAAHPPAVQERSGVGAGTESCLICHGRMANLGALSVSSAEGDKQTFSLWRCRVCLTLFLNDWTDRWERLDTLDTEERYYRLSPAEASHFLQISQQVTGGSHPAGREERVPQQQQIVALLQGLKPLSHQVRQGR